MVYGVDNNAFSKVDILAHKERETKVSKELTAATEQQLEALRMELQKYGVKIVQLEVPAAFECLQTGRVRCWKLIQIASSSC
jgi:hypothetical protein